VKTAVALLHIFFATVWLGGSFFYVILLWPALHTLETAQQRTLVRSLRSTMTPLLAVSALVTIVSGLVMMVQLKSLHPGSLSQTRWGTALVVGTLASVAALVIAFVCESRLRRYDARAGEARQAGSGPLARRERVLRLGALVLLIVALATMAVARYS
jgi:uncharacterized membrane protein